MTQVAPLAVEIKTLKFCAGVPAWMVNVDHFPSTPSLRDKISKVDAGLSVTYQY
jgi:hypothetical protein